MPLIEFRENKTLKLTNLLSRKVPSDEMFNQGKQIQMLTNWIQAKGYKPVGPLITYSSGIKGLDADNKPIIDARIMLQLQQSDVRIQLPYKFEKELRITNCLLARFNDKAENIQYATNKLTLFAYENDLTLTGETYMVFIEQTGERLMADIFMPLKNID